MLLQWNKVFGLPLQQLTELLFGWECDVQLSEYKKICACFFPTPQKFSICNLCITSFLTESNDVDGKGERVQVHLCWQNATLRKYIIYSLHFILHKCTLVGCISLLVSVLWSRGETALHKAACQRHRAICQLLVDAGASLRKTDSKVTQPSRPVIKHCNQARLISIRPCCVHDWGFLVCAKSSSFLRKLFLFRKLYWLKQVQETSVQSPTWVIFTIVRAWPQTIQCAGCEWGISMAQQHPSPVWSKERPVGRDHLGESWFLIA